MPALMENSIHIYCRVRVTHKDEGEFRRVVTHAVRATGFMFSAIEIEQIVIHHALIIRSEIRIYLLEHIQGF